MLIARDLLTADGAILVSINDENRARLELLMDEALPGMRVGSMVWRSRTGGNEGGTAFLSDNHEHVLVYGRPGFRFAGTEKTFDMYSNPDNDPEGDWRKSDMTVGVAYTDKRAGKAYYPLHDPETGTWYPCNPDAVWRYASRERSGTKGRIKTKYMEDWITEKRIIFPENPRVVVWNTKEDLLAAIRTGDVPTSGRAPLLRENLPDLDFWIGRKVGFGTPAFKRYKKHLKNPTQPLSSWITPRSETGTVEAGSNTIVSGTNDEGAKAVKDIFGTKAFNYAKPPSLIREMIRQTSSPGDIVLDFFAGSATTAQAVLELNAEDEGDRRFIMVSSTEATAEEPDKNVCRDICAMRVRRLNASRSDKQIGLVAGFAYLRARKMSFHDIDYDISPPETWAILETIHDLPLTPYDDASPWNEHAGETVTLVYIDRVTDEVIARLHALAEASRSTFVYTWAPGQIVGLADGEDVNILPVHDTLVQRFQQ